MTTNSQNESTELVALPERSKAIEVYSTPMGLEPYLQTVRKELDAFEPDASTNTGRKEIASMAYKVARSKGSLDKLGKELVAELKDVPKRVDAERKRMRDLLDQWKDEVRRPLTEWEEEEAERKRLHQEALDWISDQANGEDTVTGERLPSHVLMQRMERVCDVEVGESWEEFELTARRAKEEAIEKLKSLIEQQQKYEKDQAELERLRREREMREQQEREDRIRRETIEQEREASEARAAIEEKRKRDDEARAAREEQARISNQEHRRTINRECLEDVMAHGITEKQARDLIESIAKGGVRHLSIRY